MMRSKPIAGPTTATRRNLMPEDMLHATTSAAGKAVQRRLRDSALVKLLVAGGLVLGLLIPLAMVRSCWSRRR